MRSDVVVASVGCTVPQIAVITGHSLKNVKAILAAYYLDGTLELAEATITKLNAELKMKEAAN